MPLPFHCLTPRTEGLFIQQNKWSAKFSGFCVSIIMLLKALIYVIRNANIQLSVLKTS